MNRRHAAAAVVVMLVTGCGHRAPPGSSVPAPDRSPIEDKRFVRIGGIEQWITIKGQHRDNPIILFLHGGPGNAWSPIADHAFGSAWSERFTLVQWDQRGAGRTYSKNGRAIESTMTIDRMVQDGLSFDYTGISPRLLERTWIPSYCRPT